MHLGSKNLLHRSLPHAIAGFSKSDQVIQQQQILFDQINALVDSIDAITGFPHHLRQFQLAFLNQPAHRLSLTASSCGFGRALATIRNHLRNSDDLLCHRIFTKIEGVTHHSILNAEHQHRILQRPSGFRPLTQHLPARIGNGNLRILRQRLVHQCFKVFLSSSNRMDPQQQHHDRQT